MNFNTTSKIPNVQGTQELIPNPGLPNPQNNDFIFGNRIPLDTEASATIDFPACAYVDVTTLAGSDQAVVYYTDSALLLDVLTSPQITATFSDTTATVTGTLVEAFAGAVYAPLNNLLYGGYLILQATGFATIVAADIIHVTYTNLGLPILRPQSGYPLYEYYKTYQLPAQYVNDGLGMLEYFKSCGFSVQTGYSSSVILNGAAYADDTTLASSDQVIVYYTSSAALIKPLVGQGIVGTFVDSTASIEGTFISANVGTFIISSITYDSYIILQASNFASVVADDVITVSFDNTNLLVPDPKYTEPFLMNLFQACLATLIPTNVNSTIASPNIWFSILPNATDSGLFGPTSSAITLTIPTVVSGSVVSFAIPSLNVGYIPLSALGNTTITQATSVAVGTISSAIVNGSILNVTLSNITGTFDTSHLCTLHLDPLETIMGFQQKTFAQKNISLQQFALPYEVTTNADITTTYKPAFDYVATLNLPASAQNGQSICFIAFSNLSTSQPTAAMSLPSNVNNWQYEPIYYPYVPAIGELPCSAGQLTAAFVAVVGSNVAPLNPQGGVIINGLPTSINSDTYIDVTINGTADQVLQIGWNPIAVNNNNQAYIVNPITGQTTLPNLPTPDREFYPIYFWQTVDYLRRGITQICKNIGIGQVRQNPTILSTLKGNIVIFMNDMEDVGMLKNVLINQALIIIVQDPNNPLGIDIKIPTQVMPGVEAIYYTIQVFSSTITLQTAA